MTRGDDSFWHGLGRGFGAVISSLPGTSTLSSTGRSRPRKSPARPDEDRDRPHDALSGVLAGGVTTFVVSVMRRWSRTHRPSPRALARGAVAGAGAAGAVLLYRLLIARRKEEADGPPGRAAHTSPGEFADELLAGAGRGLIYAALLAPYLPGPPILRGAIVGSVDYLATPLGGLFSRLQEFSPIRRVPAIFILLETGDAQDDPYLAFLVHGALMGLLYGDGSGGS